MDKEISLPGTSTSQRISQRAKAAFPSLCPEHWYLTDLSGDTDFGFDYQIQAENQHGQIAYVFFSQLKGTTSPKWTDNDSVLSFSVETKTLNLYLRTAEPVLFVVIDLSGEVPCGHYLWIQDYLRTLLVEDELYLSNEQDTYTVRIPRESVLQKSLDVRDELERRIQERRLLQSLGEDLQSAAAAQKETYVDTVSRIRGGVKKHPEALFAISEVELSSPWPEAPEGSIARKLSDAAALVRDGAAEEADRVLNDVATIQDRATNHERAEHAYLLGKLAMLRQFAEQAVAHFEQATKLRTDIQKYQVSLVESQFISRHDPETNPDQTNLLPALQGIDTKGAKSLTVRILGAAGELEKADKVAATLPDGDRQASKLLVLFLRKEWQAVVDRSAVELRAKVYPRAGEVLARLLKLRAMFTIAMGPRIETDARLGAYGHKEMRLDLLPDLWKEADAFLTLLSQSGWPSAIEHIADVISAVAVIMSRHEGILERMRRAADARPTYPNLQFALERLAVMAGQPTLALQALDRALAVQPNRAAQARRVLHLFELERLEACIAEARSYVDAAESGEHYGAVATVAALSAHKLLRSDDQKHFEDKLAGNPSFQAEVALLRYAIRKEASPLEREEALQDLYHAWQPTHHQMVGLQLSRDLDATKEDEAAKCVEIGYALIEISQLGLEETIHLGQAHITLKQWDRLEPLIDEAMSRFPDSGRIRAIKALILETQGKTPDAIALLEEEFRKPVRDRLALEEYANICARLGLADKAIPLIESLLGSEKKDSPRTFQLLRLLFLLEYEKDPASRRLLDIAVRMGALASPTIELQEAQYLMTFLTATLHEAQKPTPQQLGEFQKRCQAFSQRFPRSNIFRMVTMPKSPEGFEAALRGQGLLQDTRSPEILRLERQIHRGTAIPYLWKPRGILRNVRDVAQLWEITKGTRDDPAYELLMSTGDSAVLEKLIRIDGIPLIDLVSLLLLQDLGLLNHLFTVFPKVAVSKLTLMNLRNLTHPFIGTFRAGTVRAVMGTLKNNLQKLEQPGGYSAKDTRHQLEVEMEEDLKRILASGRYVLFCDDAVFKQYVSTDVIGLRSTGTLEFLVFADQKELYAPEDVAKALAQLCLWNTGRVIVLARYFFAGIPADAHRKHSREQLERIFGTSPTKVLIDALWSHRKPYIDNLNHVAAMLAYMVRNSANAEQVIAHIWHTWQVKAKLRQDVNLGPIKHMTYTFLKTLVLLRDEELDAIRRLWAAFFRVLEWDYGSRMEVSVENATVESIGRAACIVDKDKGVDFSVSNALITRAKSAFESGTHRSDLLDRAFRDELTKHEQKRRGEIA